jgi:hypothetical protein
LGDRRGASRVLVGITDGEKPLGRPRRGWEDNIKMDLQEVGWVGMDWIALAQDRDRWRALVNAVMEWREFLDQLRTCYLLKKDFASWS